MPTNMNFKVSILPTEDNSYSLGSSTKKWKINGEDFLDLVYPIGAVYISVISTSPATLFGGTWEQIQDTFLLACGTSYNNGDIGGSTTMAHTHEQVSTTSGGPSNNTSGSTAITVAQMPSHTHTQNSHTHTQAAHRHYPFDNSGIGGLSRDQTYTWGSDYYRFNNGGVMTSAVAPSINGSTATNQNTGVGGGHTHTLSSHTHTTLATTTGDANNVNNMPPYFAVYMWKRTA